MTRSDAHRLLDAARDGADLSPNAIRAALVATGDRRPPPYRTWTLETVHQRCTDDGDCWMWAQAVNSGGHPMASVERRPGVLVRRVAFTLAKGPITPGLSIQNTCRRKLCCNPAHMAAVSNSAILTEAYASGRRSRFSATWPARPPSPFGWLLAA